eukprot:g4743.t1
MAASHPHLAKVYDAQTRYGLPSVGECSTNKDRPRPCRQVIMELGRRDRHTAATPEIFLSGALHGNERIGPTAMVELAAFMLDQYGKDAVLTHLLDTRSITVFPSPNAVGYFRSQREEMNEDPNRDFAFDTKPEMCMRTVAGRAVNEVWRDHLYQLAVTFHGGDNLIGFAWGDFPHCGADESAFSCKAPHWVAPDHFGMESLAHRLRDYAGPFGGDGLYRTGPINEVIYAVHGGMEDWSYGGSWSPSAVRCAPTGGHLGSYPAEKTTYDNVTLRAVNLLVETAVNKIPGEQTLGTTDGVLGKAGRLTHRFGADGANPGDDGHVPRNIRLAIAAIDALEPSVLIPDGDTAGDPAR